MRAAGRHTAPPVIHKRVRRPPPDPDSPLQPRQSPPAMRPVHLADPATAVRHATSLTLQTRHPPSAMRPAHLADPATAARHATSLTLQPRQSPPAMRTSPPCRPGNRRPPVMPPFLHTDPTAAARRRRSLVKQTVVPRSRPCRPPPQPKGIEGHPEGPAVGRGRRGEGSRRGGVAEGRGRGGKGLRKGGVQSEGPQPYPAWACGESGGVFSHALYHLQA